MSSKRNTAHDLNENELAALIKLRVLRIPDKTLLAELPTRAPSAILENVSRPSNFTIEERVQRALAECRRLRVGRRARAG